MEATTVHTIDPAQVADRLPPAPAGTLEGPVYQADAATTARILSEFGFIPDTITSSPALGQSGREVVVASAPALPFEETAVVQSPILTDTNRTVSVADLTASQSALEASRSELRMEDLVAPTEEPIIQQRIEPDATLERTLVDPTVELPTHVVEAFVKGRIMWKRRTLTLQNQFLYTRKKQDDEFYQRRVDLTYSTFAADVGASKKFAICINNPVPFNRIRLAFDDEATRTKWVTLFMAYKQRQLIKVGAVSTEAVHRQAVVDPALAGQSAFVPGQPAFVPGQQTAIAPLAAVQTVPAQHIVPNMGSVLHSAQTGREYSNSLPVTDNLIPKPLPDHMTFQPAVYTGAAAQPVNLQDQLEKDLEQKEMLERLHQTNLAQAPISTQSV